MKHLKKNIASLLVFGLIATSCSKDGSVNFFSVNQDVEFGRQMDSTILANPNEYPVLDRNLHPEAYTHLERIKNTVLSSDEFDYKDEFTWKVTIIDNDDVLNAFAAPGGYMYFYTGLIKYLDNEAQFAGVMAHEMAHVDHRHSTDMMTKQYGFSIMLSLLLGNNPTQLEEVIASLALGLGSLQYSKSNEYQADEFAVRYLYDTDYHPREIAGFFEKLEVENTEREQSGGKLVEFLSTHPSPDNRIEEIDGHWKSLGSKQGEYYVDRYNDFKASLDK